MAVPLAEILPVQSFSSVLYMPLRLLGGDQACLACHCLDAEASTCCLPSWSSACMVGGFVTIE